MAALPLPAAILDDLIPGTGNWEWGHPRWRPEAEGPPFSTSTSMGIEKFSLYYCFSSLLQVPELTRIKTENIAPHEITPYPFTIYINLGSILVE